MFDNIKSRIAKQTANVVVKKQMEDDDTALIAEYAHVFQELSDLTIEGTDAENNARSIEILVDNDGRLNEEDDIELDVIGFNLKTGTLDIPSDAAIRTEYAMMKTHDDFVSESANIFEYDDEDADSFDARRAKWTDVNWMKYRQTVLQEGMFGYKRVNVTAENIPSLATVSFGDYNGSPYNVRMPIQHQVDKNGNMTRKQLESIYLLEHCDFGKLMEPIKRDIRNRYHISESASIWDTMVPSVLVTPIDPIDSHSVIIGFKNDSNLFGMDFYRFSNPTSKFTTDDSILEYATVERLDNDKVKDLSKFCITKNAAIKESAKPNPHYHRGFYQEGINIGGEDNNAQASADTNSNVESNNQGSTPPDTSGNNNSNVESNNEPATVEVGKNDVSDEIANKAASETKDATPTDDNEIGSDGSTDIPDESDIPDLESDVDSLNTDSDDMGSLPDNDVTDADIDSQLQDLDASGNEESALADGSLSAGEIDIDQMSMDDLIKSGTDKLKSMSLGQLKEFLANNDEAAVQEAFILTNANINDEVDILLRKTLGVLNDNKLEINQLVNEFKKYGKKLNRVLTKASKATKVYNNNEIDNIKKLNKCLADLIVTIKASTDKSSIQVIKRLVKAFTSQAAIVGKIVEKKKKDLPKSNVKETKKNVSESYIDLGEFDYIQEALFTTAKTARENILIRSGRVSADMAKIVKAADDDKLSRGMVQKMYGGITKQITTNIEGGSSDDDIRTGYSSTKDVHIDSPEMDHLTSLISLINKITRKAAKREKWSIAFTKSEFSALEKLKSDVNEFAEDTEYLLADSTGTSEKLLNALAKEAKIISEACKEISEWPRSIT